MSVTDSNAVTNDASPDEINTSPHVPKAITASDAVDATAENKTFVRQLLDFQEYHVVNGDIIKKGFYCEASVKRFVAYIYFRSQLTVFNIYTSDIITSCTCLKLLPIDNNATLGSAQFMVDF